MPTPMTLVLFGATGDLARSKLWPALHDLAASGRLPEELSVLGISRSSSTEELRELAAEHGPGGARLESGERWQQLLEATEVVNGAADDPELYERAGGRRSASARATASPTSPCAPSLFAEIGGRLAGIGLGREAGAASRLVIEKPFGEDLASARELRAALHEHFDEEQLLRIDHYLGKEAAQNLLVLRFVNGIFEPLWDRRSIESIQVTVAEDGGVDGRGDFYDATGALRDVGQNHLLQLLALTLMDAPARVAGDELRAERLKVLRSIRPIEPGDAVLGQYEGYGDEEGVEDGSSTDTFAAMRVEVDSWRWADVPCYLRTGKRLATKAAEIAVAFRPSPHMPFEGADGWAGANRLIIGIQPGEKVRLHVTGKRPGDGLELVKVELDFDAGEAAETRRAGGLRAPARRRDRRRHDARSPPATRSRRSGPRSSRCCATAPEPVTYEPGTAGPEEADDIPGRDGRRWRPLG